MEEEKYCEELINNRSNENALKNLYDILNIAFGQTIETQAFWNEILIPKAAEAFSYSIERLSKYKPNLNAIFFSFAKHFGLDIDHTKKLELGKSDKPFTDQIKDITGKSQVYNFRQLPCNLFAEQYKEYKKEGNQELVLKALREKQMITQMLECKASIVVQAEIAEFYLTEGLIDKAITTSLEGIKLTHSMNAEVLRFYCILMRSFYEKKDFNEGDKYCSKALEILNYHWGQYHPLHCTIYSILAYLLIKHKESHGEALSIYKVILVSYNKLLGNNHSLIAETYMNIGKLLISVGKKEKALANFDKALSFYIDEEKYKKQLADCAYQIGVIKKEQKKYKDAFNYAVRAVDIYSSEIDIKMLIKSLWLAVSVSCSVASNVTVSKDC